MENLSEAEKQILSANTDPGEEVEERIAITDLVEHPPYIDQGGQVLLPTPEGKAIGARTDLNSAFKSVETRIENVKDHGKFFKSFSAYLAELDVEKDRESVRSNVESALLRAGDLIGDLQFALAQLKKADEIEALLAEIEPSDQERKEPRPPPTIKMLDNDEESDDE